MKPLSRPLIRLLILFFCLSAGGAAQAQQDWRIEPAIQGLDQPWGVAPLPGGGALVTQRGGELILARNGSSNRVSGVPRVQVQGQGGLLDITLARDFEQTRTLFLSYATAQQGGAGTR